MKVFNRAIEKYMDSYNRKRLHSAIDYKTPNEVYYQYINNLDFRGGKLFYWSEKKGALYFTFCQDIKQHRYFKTKVFGTNNHSKSF